MSDNTDTSIQDAIDAPITENIKMIVGGIAGVMIIVIPILLIRAIGKRINEGSEIALKKFEQKLG